MGNQYSISTADQILSVEHYFAELASFTLVQKLGSTRFMKVTRAAHEEGPCVVKIFLFQDRSMRIEPYEKALIFQRDALKSTMHCLPFSFLKRSEHFAALGRSFIKETLYERMNGRPYLLDIEKRWIAFQLLLALQECHDKRIIHGDIKSSNIVLTSWCWTYLTDFAGFKPATLPDSDPADFNFYFDTNRKRTCYIAPERFTRGVMDLSEMSSSKSTRTEGPELKTAGLHWSMDIFSMGCVFMEFFGDGEVPFDLSRLLAFRNGDYRPEHVLQKIECPELRDLAEHMTQRDPSLRLPASQYLNSLRGKGFPEVFYTFLNDCLFKYTTPNIPDDNVISLQKSMPEIMSKLTGEDSSCLVLILSLLLSQWRSLTHSDAKLAAFKLAEELAPRLPVEVVLDRLLPYLLSSVDDPLPIVRTNFIITFVKVLQIIPTIRRNEGHIFRAYILPDLEKLVDDPDQSVRVTFAMHIAPLAETAMRFLEISYLSSSGTSSQELVYNLHDEDRYPFDVERGLLLRDFQSLLERLILKQGNTVKRALLEHGMGRLCQVFGRKFTHEIILPHLVTFLNEKPDWPLRAAFFGALVDLAAFAGNENAGVFRALLEQGLTDPEEFVVFHALRSFLDLMKLGLLPKKSATELLGFCASLLLHPNSWIRKTAVALFVSASKKADFVDRQIRIRPILLPFLERPITHIEEEEALLGALIAPLSRRVFTFFTQSKNGRTLLHFLFANAADSHAKLNEFDEEKLRQKPQEFQLYQKFLSMELDEKERIKLLLTKEFILRLRPPSVSFEKTLSSEANEQVERTKTVHKVPQSVPVRSVPDIPGFDADDPSGVIRGRKQVFNDYILRTAMSDEWEWAFGPQAGTAAGPSEVQGRESAQVGEREASPDPVTQQGKNDPASGAAMKKVRVPGCQVELQRYITVRHQERGVELSNEVSLTDMEPPPLYYDMLKDWRPSGSLVAHLHEHHQSVIRLRANRSNGDILSCSLDGMVKLWDCGRMEGRGLSNRAKFTYKNLGSPVRAITYCEEWKSFACSGDSGKIHVVRLESDTSKNVMKLERAIDASRDGMIIEMAYSDPVSQNIIVFATSMGTIAGWDLRTPNFVWKLQSDLRWGMLKTFCVSPEQSWVTTGSSDGYLVTWDMRFRIPISYLMHPRSASIHRLYTHPRIDSAVIACAKGGNEVSVWDTESSNRTLALWSGNANPLACEAESKDTVRGLQVLSVTETNQMALVTAGTDRRIRFWDTSAPEQSYYISSAHSDVPSERKMLCRNVNVDDVQVTHEYQSEVIPISSSASMGSMSMAFRSREGEAGTRFAADVAPAGHADAIDDLVICSTGSQLFLVTASRDGIIKVWK